MTPPTADFCFQLGYQNGNTLHFLPATCKTEFQATQFCQRLQQFPGSDRTSTGPWCCSLTLITRGLLFDHGQRGARRGLAQRVPAALLDLHLHLGEGRSSLEGSTTSWMGTPKDGTGQERQSPCHREFLDSHSKLFSAFWLNH